MTLNSRVATLGLGAILTVGLAAALVPMAIGRIVDADEGIYLINARAVINGEVPYVDFFYPQMFLLPYVYGAWMSVFGVSWYAGRTLSAIFAIVLGVLVAHHATRLTGRRAFGVLAAALFALNCLSLTWLTVVKTYPLATCLLFAAYSVIFTNSARWKYFVSGLCVGLAVDVRLYLVVVIPVLVFELIRRERGTPDLRLQLARFAVGLGVALLPVWYFVLLDPQALIFNVLGVHSIRSPFGYFGALSQKFDVFLDMIAARATYGPASLQFAILLFINAAALIAVFRLRERLHLSLLIALVVGAVSLIPTPAYAQYFCMVVPFLVISAVRFVAQVSGDESGPRLGPLVPVLLGAYLLVAPLEIYRYAVRGEALPGVLIGRDPVSWRISTIREVSRAIDAAVPESRPLAISWWPGYFVETRASILPRLENPYGLWYSGNLSSGDVQRYKFISHLELAYHLYAHTAPVVVVRSEMFNMERHYEQHYRTLLSMNGYAVIERVGGVEIYRWPAPPGQDAARPVR